MIKMEVANAYSIVDKIELDPTITPATSLGSVANRKHHNFIAFDLIIFVLIPEFVHVLC